MKLGLTLVKMLSVSQFNVYSGYKYTNLLFKGGTLAFYSPLIPTFSLKGEGAKCENFWND
jgi:hypothetical protein